jgi:uncharacterized membrane protein YraQ (UPF0718 family)
VTDILLGVISESWHILNESAPYVLFGFFMAALAKAFISEDTVVRHLGKNNFSSVLKASLFGVPLPLCSCGVIPAAIGIRKQGAGKGATTAFMISTPESGVDSIAITWALLDPIMTVMRPLSAFLTATVAGVLVNAAPDKEEIDKSRLQTGSGCGCTGCGCKEEIRGAGNSFTPLDKPPLPERLKEGFSYAFGGLIGDIGSWLLFGIVIAGVISYFVPADFFHDHVKGEFSSLLIMLAIGIPLYICATASTPIAAALVLKGLSPGAALVLLLAGPATNAATLTVVTRMLGRKVAIIYVASIAVCSILMGWAVNRLYSLIGFDVTQWVQGMGESGPNGFSIALSIVLIALITRSILPVRGNKKERCGCSGAHPHQPLGDNILDKPLAAPLSLDSGERRPQ